MTDEDFKKVTRHEVENLIAQRDDALTRISAFDAEITQCNDVIDSLKNTLRDRDAMIAKLMENLADETAKCENMAGHPDVIAAKKQAAIAQAKAEQATAIQMKTAAEKALADLGVQ